MLLVETRTSSFPVGCDDVLISFWTTGNKTTSSKWSPAKKSQLVPAKWYFIDEVCEYVQPKHSVHCTSNRWMQKVWKFRNCKLDSYARNSIRKKELLAWRKLCLYAVTRAERRRNTLRYLVGFCMYKLQSHTLISEFLPVGKVKSLVTASPRRGAKISATTPLSLASNEGNRFTNSILVNAFDETSSDLTEMKSEWLRVTWCKGSGRDEANRCKWSRWKMKWWLRHRLEYCLEGAFCPFGHSWGSSKGSYPVKCGLRKWEEASPTKLSKSLCLLGTAVSRTDKVLPLFWLLKLTYYKKKSPLAKQDIPHGISLEVLRRQRIIFLP